MELRSLAGVAVPTVPEELDGGVAAAAVAL